MKIVEIFFPHNQNKNPGAVVLVLSIFKAPSEVSYNIVAKTELHNVSINFFIISLK